MFVFYDSVLIPAIMTQYVFHTAVCKSLLENYLELGC